MSHGNRRDPLWVQAFASGSLILLVVSLWSDSTSVDAGCFLGFGVAVLVMAVAAPLPQEPQAVQDIIRLLPAMAWRILLAVASLAPIGIGLLNLVEAAA